MQTEMNQPPHDAVQFTRNLVEATEKAQRVLQSFLSRQAQDAMNAPVDPLNVGTAFMDMYAQMWRNPGKVVEKNLELWGDYMNVWQSAAQSWLGEKTEPAIEADTRDRRFKDPAWQENMVFDFIKQSYLVTARWLQSAVSEVEGLEPKTAQKIDFYTRQFVDAMAPSNFPMTNPEVLRTTLETGGENLVKGLQNMLEDIERGDGSLRISMTDAKAFEVGKNLALTPGKVVFRNDLIELLQYTPTTQSVHKTPVLFIPAWINKFYILDMQPDNSMVKWLVEQGYTVFVISWVNPNETLGRKRFDDYMLEGPVAAMEAIEQATGEKEIHAVGYCLGGTLLSITLAWLHAKKKQNRVLSATFFTTMLDFTEAGELSVFIDEEQLRTMETRMSEKGFLEGADMAMTFNMLRANDLIWSFVINNYMLGKDPFPFDLLYWNSDSTRMPAVMHSFYLRNMYQQNKLIEKGGITIDGVPIDLSTITTPAIFLSAREDHIAPWKSTYSGAKHYGGPVEFVLAASGHIAGMINPPARNKYSHWESKKLPDTADAWFEGAVEKPGSWWGHWERWLDQKNPAMVPARKPGDGKLKPLADAPGEYVKVNV